MRIESIALLALVAFLSSCSAEGSEGRAGSLGSSPPTAAGGTGAFGPSSAAGSAMGRGPSAGLAGISAPSSFPPSVLAGAPATPPPAAMPTTPPLPAAGAAAPPAGTMRPPVTMPPQPPAAGGMAGAPAPTMPTMPAPAGNMEPTVPMLTAECPAFRSGTISFMGLGGITVSAGAKASSPSAPMVFYWHGTGSFSGEYAGSAAAVNQGVVSEGGVLISFQGTTGGDFLSGTAIFGEGDMKLSDQLLACAVKNHNVDSHRVFATGCSAGGLFSTAMAAMRSQYMAAAAPNSGGVSIPIAFANKHTPALMTIHGAPGVDVVGIDFSQSSATADKMFKGAGGFVINCNHGGGHCGGGGLAGDIWKFFKAHPFGVNPAPWTGGLPAGFSSKCKIY